MSYRCGACGATVPPGRQRLLHVTQRVRWIMDGRECLEVESEMPVCQDCKRGLDAGASLDSLRLMAAAERRLAEVVERRSVRTGLAEPEPERVEM